MNIIVKGVNYPESCIDCTFLDEDWDDEEDTYIAAYCGATDDYREIYDSRKDNRTHEEVVTRKPDWCPVFDMYELTKVIDPNGFRTPKRPTKDSKNKGFLKCPNCGKPISHNSIHNKHRFCVYCGQAILWE